MAELFKTIAVLLVVVVVLAVAEASILRSTATDIENEADNQSRCEIVIMNRCLRFLEQEAKITTSSPESSSNQASRTMRQLCCNQIRPLSADCRCENLRNLIQLMKESGDYKGEDIRGMMDTASRIPSICSMQPHSCTMSTTY